VTIASGVVFVNHDGGSWVFRDQKQHWDGIKYGRITIHDNCFIGEGAILLPGIEIGPNAIVAAGAVVSRPVPPDSVAGGVPARVLMSLDEYATRSRQGMPDYDRAAYARNKKRELLRIFPRPW
jgi:acetyltransferase-like isoleucine patch superfamily enzyme